MIRSEWTALGLAADEWADVVNTGILVMRITLRELVWHARVRMLLEGVTVRPDLSRNHKLQCHLAVSERTVCVFITSKHSIASLSIATWASASMRSSTEQGRSRGTP
jgi:hypothetical protein